MGLDDEAIYELDGYMDFEKYLLFGGNITISAINQVHYGVFLTNDRTEGNFAELMPLFLS